MKIRFWGTRGSLAKPGPSTLRYGGNTSCVEVRTDAGTLAVMDCGTGSHELGQQLLRAGQPGGHLFITHTHWDHIQGLPFFAPLFTPGMSWNLYGPGGLGSRFEATLAGQMEYTYFPVALEQLAAQLKYHDLAEGAHELGELKVVSRYMNHPALTLGYRPEAGGRSVVYAVDHEPHSVHFIEPGVPAHQQDREHLEFMAGADLVIHDAQYTLEEYPKKVGWGHSPAEVVVDYAVAAGVKLLALYHHDPLRDDASLEALLEICRRRADDRVEVIAAAEGLEIELAETVSETPALPAGRMPALAEIDTPTVLVADDDPDTLGLLLDTLRAQGFRLLSASDGDMALKTARAERPALILLDWGMPGRTGIEVCQALREDGDDVPIVFLTAYGQQTDLMKGFEAGATDYVTKPFSAAHIRSRVRSWLLRKSLSSL